MSKVILILSLLFCSTLHANVLNEKCERVVEKLMGTQNYNNDPKKPERVSVCVQILIYSFIHKLDSSIALAIAWTESNFTYADNGICKGPLQIKVEYWCENSSGNWNEFLADGVERNCDLVARGVFAISYWKQRTKTIEQLVCRYGGFKECSSAAFDSYFKKFLKFRKIISRAST
jgi:hypothetical protein